MLARVKNMSGFGQADEAAPVDVITLLKSLLWWQRFGIVSFLKTFSRKSRFVLHLFAVSFAQKSSDYSILCIVSFCVL